MAGTPGIHRFRGGAGRLCLDFVRTLRHRGLVMEAEELPNPAAVSAWVRQFGPWPTAVSADGRDAEARLLREAIHQLIAAARGPRGIASCPEPARRTVNAFASWPVPAPRLDPSGRLRLDADDRLAAALALVARDALDLVTSAELSRVRECAGPDCHALFLDTSRPGSRRWCSMNACGNRAKKAQQKSHTSN